MLFDKFPKFPRTLAFRLTVWYAGIFTVSSLLAFLFFYLQIASIIGARRDTDLLDDIKDYSRLLAGKGLEEVQRTMVVDAKQEGEDKTFYRLLAPDGNELSSTDLSSWGDLAVNRPALKRINESGKPAFKTLAIQGRQHKVRTVYGSI